MTEAIRSLQLEKTTVDRCLRSVLALSRRQWSGPVGQTTWPLRDIAFVGKCSVLSLCAAHAVHLRVAPRSTDDGQKHHERLSAGAPSLRKHCVGAGSVPCVWAREASLISYNALVGAESSFDLIFAMSNSLYPLLDDWVPGSPAPYYYRYRAGIARHWSYIYFKWRSIPAANYSTMHRASPGAGGL